MVEAKWESNVPSPSHSEARPTGAALGRPIPTDVFGAPPGQTAKGSTYVKRMNGGTAAQNVQSMGRVRSTFEVKTSNTRFYKLPIAAKLFSSLKI